MSSPLISVVVPVYNAEKTLRQCVDSILSQEYKDFELILVDDGSKDASPQICDEYALKNGRVKVFHKPNGGVSSARNLGLDHVEGEWVSFIDSDDYVSEGYFEEIVGHGEDILIRGYQKFNCSGICSGRDSEVLAKEQNFVFFLNNYLTDTVLRGPVFKFYKQELIGDLRFLTDMKIGEDAWFVFQYLAKCKSHAVLAGGEYMVRLAEEPDEVKYAITVDYAVNSLNHLRDAFGALVDAHAIDKSLFLHFIGYYKRISKSNWQDNPSLWWKNVEVKRLYAFVWPSLDFKQKLRLIIARFFRK